MKIDEFIVSIGPPCSGIESLFFCFFAGLYALDYRKIKAFRYFAFFIVGVIAVNILWPLLLAGVSPTFAPLPRVFFIAYFLAYYWLIKRWIYKKDD